MNCVLAQKGKDSEWKKMLLEKHTLEAVFSMPNELFNPAASTVTAIIVFKAHIIHAKNYETYFGYWKDDGFVKVKPIGRIDLNGQWEKIKSSWIYNYKNKKEIRGNSIKKVVNAENEWCSESYMETDYSKLTENDFIDVVKNYIAFEFMNEKGTNANS